VPQKKSTGQLPVSAPKIIFKVSSALSAESAVKVQAQPIAKAESQPVAKVQTRPFTEMKPWSSFSVAALQAKTKIEAKKSESEKPRRKRRKTREIKYFGLSWKKNSNDNRGSDFRANDVIFKCKDGIGSAIRPTCCLCGKAYCPDFLYVRCEQCKGNSIRHNCYFKLYLCVIC
jgi:hypothetical protein